MILEIFLNSQNISTLIDFDVGISEHLRRLDVLEKCEISSPIYLASSNKREKVISTQ